MKKYTPNYADPRVKRKIHDAVRWSFCSLRPHEARPWARTHLDKRIGRTNENLGYFLRSNLLTQEKYVWDMLHGKTKTYRLNLTGAHKLLSSIGISPTKRSHKRLAIDYLKERYHKELESGEFQYKDKSNRWWNECQSISSDLRRELFRTYNYIYNYDIKSSAPTLIYEYCRTTGISQRLRLDLIREYLRDPKTARQQLADRIGVEYAVAKRIIICAFSGARMGPTNAIAREIKNRISYHKLSRDQWFTQLQKQITKLWRHIKHHRGINKISSATKWRIYFELERSVMWHIVDLFKKNHAKMFLEHDGWRSNTYIATDELTAHVKKKTGYHVLFDLEVLKQVPSQRNYSFADAHS